MKKLKVGLLENVEENKIKIFEFLNNFDLESISSLYVTTEKIDEFNTIFKFITNKGQEVRFYYRKNQFIRHIRVWEEGMLYVGMISSLDNIENEQWLTDIWNQIVDHFNLGIRLLFINETTPWKWDTEFTY